MKQKFFRISAVLLLLLVVIVLYNIWGNRVFRTTFYQIRAEKTIRHLRIVELADLHLQEYGENNSELVTRVANLSPDIIAIAGDLNIDRQADYQPAITLLEQLVDIAPVYYAPGNHEWAGMYALNNVNLFRDIQATGVHWLCGSYEEAQINGSDLLIGGLFEYPGSGLSRAESQTVAEELSGREEYTILLCHYPAVAVDTLSEYTYDLVLSGHTHGGQIRLPLLGGLWVEGEGLFPEYTSGLHELENTTLIISRGLGNSDHIIPRINNQPELVVVDIR